MNGQVASPPSDNSSCFPATPITRKGTLQTQNSDRFKSEQIQASADSLPGSRRVSSSVTPQRTMSTPGSSEPGTFSSSGSMRRLSLRRKTRCGRFQDFLANSLSWKPIWEKVELIMSSILNGLNRSNMSVIFAAVLFVVCFWYVLHCVKKNV